MIPLPHVAGGFRVIATDVPWLFAVRSAKGEGRSACRHYAILSSDEIKALPIATIAARDCHLFFWTTGPHLPQALEVMTAWGFRYSGVAFTWIKLKRSMANGGWRACDTIESALHVGMGYTTRKNSESCLLGRRGNPKRLSASVREVIIAPVREHSRKPDEFYERVERYSAGPRLDLFARQLRPNWIAWGDEATKFTEIRDPALRTTGPRISPDARRVHPRNSNFTDISL